MMKSASGKKALIILMIAGIFLLAGIAGAVGISACLYTQRAEAVFAWREASGETNGRFADGLNQSLAALQEVISLQDQESAQSARMELESSVEKTDEALALMKAACQNEEELEYIRTIDKKFSEYKTISGQAAELARQGRNAEALVLYREQAEPLLDECLDAARQLEESGDAAADAVSAKLAGHKRTVTVIILSALSVILAVCALLGAVVFGRFPRRDKN